MEVKYLVLDFGYVLFYPVSGDWFITPKFLELVDINKIDKEKLKKAVYSEDYFINRKMTTYEEEYEDFKLYYTAIFEKIGYDISEKKIEEIVYNFAYECDKYNIYDGVKEELEMLSKKYTLIMLSDNWPCGNRMLKKAGIYDYFEKIYFSSYYGVRKKDKVFFDYPIKDFNIKNKQAIFVDDNEDLLKIAEEKGFIAKRMNREKKEMKSNYQIINNLRDI